VDRTDWTKFPSFDHRYLDRSCTDFFYSLTILAGNLISNSLQGAIGIGNLRRRKVGEKEEKVEKQAKSERKDFSFHQEVSK